MVLATSIVGVIKMGNNVPRTGLKPTSLAFQLNVLPLQHIGSLISLLYPRLSIYAASWLDLQGSVQTTTVPNLALSNTRIVQGLISTDNVTVVDIWSISG